MTCSGDTWLAVITQATGASARLRSWPSACQTRWFSNTEIISGVLQFLSSDYKKGYLCLQHQWWTEELWEEWRVKTKVRISATMVSTHYYCWSRTSHFRCKWKGNSPSLIQVHCWAVFPYHWVSKLYYSFYKGIFKRKYGPFLPNSSIPQTSAVSEATGCPVYSRKLMGPLISVHLNETLQFLFVGLQKSN